MRKYEDLFLTFWVAQVREFRIKMNLTQEKMSEKLCLNTRNYQKLEQGVHQPSAITLILFLHQLSDQELRTFVHTFGRQVETAHSQEVA